MYSVLSLATWPPTLPPMALRRPARLSSGMDPELKAYLDRKFDAIGSHFELLEVRGGS